MNKSRYFTIPTQINNHDRKRKADNMNNVHTISF